MNTKKTALTENSWVQLVSDYMAITPNEFEELWDLRPTEPAYVKMFGKEVQIPRQQALFGERNYRFSGTTVQNRPLEHRLMKKVLEDINRVNPEFEYNGIFVNWYKDGEEYIGWHSDDEKDLVTNAPIYSISFGATRKFKLKNKKTGETTDINLENGTMLAMGGDTQKEFKHSVPKTKKCKERRINFTVRCFVRKL